MNKKTYIIGGLLTITIIVSAIVLAVLLGSKKEGRYEEENSSIKLNSIKTETDKIVQKFDVDINGKKNIFEIEYFSRDDGSDVQILGRIPESEIEWPINGTDQEINDFLSDNFNETRVHDYVTENDFKFLKGEDGKTYLLFVFKTNHYMGGYADYLYIYNENLKLVTGDVNYNGCSNDEAFTIRTHSSGIYSEEEPGKSGYKDTENFLGYRNDKDSYLNLKIEGNRIYYLKALVNYFSVDDELGTIEERIYTIKDDKLEYTVKNEFVIKDAAGIAC